MNIKRSMRQEERQLFYIFKPINVPDQFWPPRVYECTSNNPN